MDSIFFEEKVLGRTGANLVYEGEIAALFWKEGRAGRIFNDPPQDLTQVSMKKWRGRKTVKGVR